MPWVSRPDGFEEWREGPEGSEVETPAPASFGETFMQRSGLSGLGKASEWVQRELNLKKLSEYTPEWTERVPLSPRNVVRSLGVIGQGIGALPAEIGARMDQPDIAPEVLREARGEGMKAGGTALQEAFTPLDIAGGAPGKVGVTANVLDALLGAGDIAAGVEEKDLARGGMGAFRVAANLAGMPRGPRQLKGEPRIEAEVDVPSSPLREDVPLEPELAGAQMAGKRATKAAYIKRLQGAGYDVDESFFRGKTADYIRQYAKDRGVDLSDVVIQRLPETAVADLEPGEAERLLPPREPKVKPEVLGGLANEVRLGTTIERMLEIRGVAEKAGDEGLLKLVDEAVKGKWSKRARKAPQPVQKPVDQDWRSRRLAELEKRAAEEEIPIEGEPMVDVGDEPPVGEIKALSDKDLRIELEEVQKLPQDEPAVQKLKAALEAEARSREPGQLMGPKGEILELDIDRFEEALKQADERADRIAGGERVARLQDPVDYALQNMSNIAVDHFNRFAHETPVGKQFGPRTPIEETMATTATSTMQDTGYRAIRRAPWMAKAQGAPTLEDRLIIARPGNAASAAYDLASTSGVAPEAMYELIMKGDPNTLSEFSKLYRRELVDTLGHELVHSFRDTYDTSRGQGIPNMQRLMDESGQMLMDTQRGEGKTLRQELEAWTNPTSPQLEAVWQKDAQTALRVWVQSKRIQQLVAQLIGASPRVAEEIGQAAVLKGQGRPIDTLPDTLKERLRFAFSKQRLGRVEANQMVKRLRARQLGAFEDLEEAVAAGTISRQDALVKYRQLASGAEAGVAPVETPRFAPEEVEKLLALTGDVRRIPRIMDRYRAGESLEKLIAGKQLDEAELKLMRRVFGSNLESVGLEPGWFEKWSDAYLKLAGSMRALMTSLDVSAVLRQSLIPSVSHPVIAGRSLVQSLTKIWSDEAYALAEKAILNNPMKDLQREAGLHLSQPGGGLKYVESLEPGGAEEMFAPSFAHKLPHVKYSERAYILYLNKMRSDLFNKMAVQYTKAGITPETNFGVYEELAHAVNDLTGRGEFGELAYIAPGSKIGKALGIKETLRPGQARGGAALPLMNAMFFAPRFMWSRLSVLRDLPLLYMNYSAPVRNMMLRDVFTTIGTGLTVLAAAAELTGGKLENDPRSSDFGKLRVGDTRYDPWGGMQPWVRFVAQQLTQSRKPVRGGRAVPFKRGEWRKNLYQFFEQKGAPGATLAIDVLSGEKAYGEQVNFLDAQFPFLGKDLASRLTPIMAQDFYDLWNDGEMEQLAIAAPLSALGVGVQTYDRRLPTRRVNP